MARVRLHEADDNGAAFQLPDLLNCERLHSYDNIRPAEDDCLAIGPLHLFIECIRKACARAGSALHHDPGACLSQFFGYLGHQVANVPIVKGIKPPKELFELDPAKIVGLTIHADRLAEIRRARVRNLGANNRRYAELTEVYDELDEAAAVQKRLGCPVIDISELSIEETAQRILCTVESRRADAAAARAS